MDKKYSLNEHDIFLTSKELTKIAMEQGLIKPSTSPDLTAKNVYSFFETIYDSFSENNEMIINY